MLQIDLFNSIFSKWIQTLLPNSKAIQLNDHASKTHTKAISLVMVEGNKAKELNYKN